MNVTAVFAYIIIVYWLCQLLSCNFASLCVRATSAICGFSVREFFFVRAFSSDFVSAALQTFCCHITQNNLFPSYVLFSCVSFVCVRFHRFLACVRSLRQRTCVTLQATKQTTNSTTLPNASLLTAPSFILFLFYALRVSSREPIHASFSKGGHSYIVDTLVLNVLCILTA